MYIQVVLGLQQGDEGKGKICHSLLSGGSFTHCVRFNGGGNAGHTIYHNGQKFVTHLVPSGVFFGVRSVVGPGCVVAPKKFIAEVKDLEAKLGHPIDVKVARNAHVVTRKHLELDSSGSKIGSTKTGNGPCYTDKYSREGIRAESIPELQPYLVDMYEEFYTKKNAFVLAEGAQATGLDIDWGDYPYVTSSHCGVGGVLNNGFKYSDIDAVYGVIKAYETYVGTKPFQPEGKVFEQIQEVGQEIGATTGRKRQVNWLNWSKVERAITMQGVTHLLMNKADVLEKVGRFALIDNEKLVEFDGKDSFYRYIHEKCRALRVILTTSETPESTVLFKGSMAQYAG